MAKMNLENEITILNSYSSITEFEETAEILVTSLAYREARERIRKYLLERYEIHLDDDKLTTDNEDFVEIKLYSDKGILKDVSAYGCQLVTSIQIS